MEKHVLTVGHMKISFSFMNMKPLQFNEIEEDAISLIAEKYQRSEESLQEDVTTVKNWMKTQHHLPEILDDKVIQNFLLLNKCSLEKAKQRIDMYYTIRSLIPDIFENINPQCPNIKQAMEIAAVVVLPKLTKDKYRVGVFKIRNQDLVDKLEPHNVMAVILNLYELRLKEDVMLGDVVIFDLKGLNFGIVKKLTPMFFSKVLALYEKVLSTPLKAVYIVNSLSFVGTVLAIVKKLMKPKIFDRIVVCEDTSILIERFPKSMLPKDYGGDGPSVEELHERTKEKFSQYQDHFDKLDKLRVNESLRPQKLENDETLGFYGNFKKLDVD